MRHLKSLLFLLFSLTGLLCGLVGVAVWPGDHPDPADARADSLVLGGFSILFIGTGLTGITRNWRRKRRRAWLQRHGRPVEAALLGLVQDWGPSGAYFVVQCQWFDPLQRQVHVFESEPVHHKPERFVAGQMLRVLIDPHNPRRHWVDLQEAISKRQGAMGMG